MHGLFVDAMMHIYSCDAIKDEFMQLLLHLVEYLAGTPSFKITYRRSKGSSNLLSGYADADWENSCSRRSTSGTLMLYNKTPIRWRSKMQKSIALSTAEAEYYSAGTEILYQSSSGATWLPQKMPTPV